jgi:hypothetical protein
MTSPDARTRRHRLAVTNSAKAATVIMDKALADFDSVSHHHELDPHWGWVVVVTVDELEYLRWCAQP